MASDEVLASLSNQLAAAVETAAAATVLVSARRRLPSSGIAWDASTIVTADHTIESDEDVEVTTASGASLKATVAGRDPGSDIAVLRVSGGALTPAQPAPAESARVGSIVLAIGRPSEEGPMASFGIISSVGGPFRTRSGSRISGYLRSDTTFFPGFSGGPLIDPAGRVVGINSSRLGRGTGLTIPLEAARPIINDLVSGGHVRRAYLGVSSQAVPLTASLASAAGGQSAGLLVVMVEPNAAAEAAGLLVGDILVRAGESTLTEPSALQAELYPERIGQPLTFTILRGGAMREVVVTPGERPW